MMDEEEEEDEDEDDSVQCCTDAPPALLELVHNLQSEEQSHEHSFQITTSWSRQICNI